MRFLVPRALVLTAVSLALAPSQSIAIGGAEADSVRYTTPPALRLSSPETKALRGPVDEDRYIVGPGDVFALTVWAQATTAQRALVNPEGELVLPGIATIPVAGITLRKAKERIRTGIESQYRNVEVDVSLVGLRQIEVNVIGNVIAPGTYTGTALDSASQLILAAGGLREGASRRNIQMTRRSGDTRRVDLVRYERLGDLRANPPIIDGDLIFVPFGKQEVLIDGGVEAPGIYEFVEGDDIGSLIDIAGGLTRDARRDTLELREFVDDDSTREVLIALDEPGRAWPLEDGDQIYVRRHSEFRTLRTVTLSGEFVFPGPYGIAEGQDRILDVVEKAGGFTERASLVQTRLVRSSGAEKVDREFERLKEIPVQDMSKTEYAYFKSRTRELKGTVVVDFERLMAGDESQNVLLEAGDEIESPQERETVTVSGSVTFPGLIRYLPDMEASYYIEQAGGYASTADRGDTKVIKARTGEWEPVGDAGTIVPGDEIWVPEKSDTNWWELTKDVVAFSAQIAAIYLVIDTATR